MIFFRNILVETYRKAILHKSFILKIVAAVATILLASLVRTPPPKAVA